MKAHVNTHIFKNPDGIVCVRFELPQQHPAIIGGLSFFNSGTITLHVKEQLPDHVPQCVVPLHPGSAGVRVRRELGQNPEQRVRDGLLAGLRGRSDQVDDGGHRHRPGDLPGKLLAIRPVRAEREKLAQGLRLQALHEIHQLLADRSRLGALAPGLPVRVTEKLP